MNALLFLIPAALGLGLLALGAFVWTVRTRQYRDMEGDGARSILGDETILDRERAHSLRRMDDD